MSTTAEALEALESVEGLRADLVTAAAVTAELRAELETARREAVSEQSARCDLEADIQTATGLSVEDGLREVVFELIGQRNDARAELEAVRAERDALRGAGVELARSFGKPQ